MEFINIQDCKVSNNDIVISRKFIYIILYLYICAINYLLNSINAYFNKKEEKVEEIKEEEKDVDTWYTIVEGQTRYKGEWKNGLPNGKGVKEYFGTKTSHHAIIECNFVDGDAEGYGKEIYDITDEDEIFAPYYEGEFKDSKQNGNGSYYWGDGSYHIGEYCDGDFHGKGIHYNKQKNIVWIGEYADNKKLKGDWYAKI